MEHIEKKFPVQFRNTLYNHLKKLAESIDKSKPKSNNKAMHKKHVEFIGCE